MIETRKLEGMREERGINKGTMATLVGYQRVSSWSRAVENEAMPAGKKRLARDAFEYYDKFGYVPEPREIGNGE